jgi:predicted DNA-binding ribbon-helix-helix protein
LVLKHSVKVAGHDTSVTLEDAFWDGLKEIATARDTSVSELITAINSKRQKSNLSSAIRVFVLDFYRNGGDGQLPAGLHPSSRRTLPESGPKRV